MDWMEQIEPIVKDDYRRRPECVLFPERRACHVINKRGRGVVGRLIVKHRKRGRRR